VKVPAIAKKTFDEFRNKPEFLAIVRFVVDKLSRVSCTIKRAQLVHKIVDSYNQEVFANPLVKQLSPCQKGCFGCCHTQVSVTEDEAQLLAKRVEQGLKIDTKLLKMQAQVSENNSEFYRLSFEDRKCVFLDDQGACRVYEDRPSVCRTNAVIGDAKQCYVENGMQKLVLVKTNKSDMAIYASFLFAKDSGSLPAMLEKALKKSCSVNSQADC
jgi:uncharacterized protein